MIEKLTNREVLELSLAILFWGQIFIIALLGYLIYRINQVAGRLPLIVRGITKLIGIAGE